MRIQEALAKEMLQRFSDHVAAIEVLCSTQQLVLDSLRFAAITYLRLPNVQRAAEAQNSRDLIQICAWAKI